MKISASVRSLDPWNCYRELLYGFDGQDITILTNDSPSRGRKNDETMVIVLRAGHMFQ
jgi:hypothetical protein